MQPPFSDRWMHSTVAKDQFFACRCFQESLLDASLDKHKVRTPLKVPTRLIGLREHRPQPQSELLLSCYCSRVRSVVRCDHVTTFDY